MQLTSGGKHFHCLDDCLDAVLLEWVGEAQATSLLISQDEVGRCSCWKVAYAADSGDKFSSVNLEGFVGGVCRAEGVG